MNTWSSSLLVYLLNDLKLMLTFNHWTFFQVTFASYTNTSHQTRKVYMFAPIVTRPISSNLRFTPTWGMTVAKRPDITVLPVTSLANFTTFCKDITSQLHIVIGSVCLVATRNDSILTFCYPNLKIVNTFSL